MRQLDCPADRRAVFALLHEKNIHAMEFERMKKSE